MKIIKRIVAEKIATGERTPAPKSPQEDRRGMVGVVKGWITERDDNRRIEKINAARSLFEWKTAVVD